MEEEKANGVNTRPFPTDSNEDKNEDKNDDKDEDKSEDNDEVKPIGDEMHVDGHDNELGSQHVQLISQNQQGNQAPGNFMKTNLSGTHDVTATGTLKDPETIWKVHYTLDNDHELVVILENKQCTEHFGQTSVLATIKDGNTGHHFPSVKQIERIPTRLSQMEPSISFYKKLRSPGSECVYLESVMKSEQPLLVGFDQNGQPMPMETVKKFTFYEEAYFRVIGHKN